MIEHERTAVLHERTQQLVDDLREEVSCCCSWHRTIAINDMLDEMQKMLNEMVAISDVLKVDRLRRLNNGQ
jgi:hypothetical protein